MKETELFLYDKKEMKSIIKQVFNLFVVSMVLFLMIDRKAIIWVIPPVIIAIIILSIMLTVSIINFTIYRHESGPAILRCYKWGSMEATKDPGAYKIYSDKFIYVELSTDNVGYDRFRLKYNTAKKIDRLIKRNFSSLMV